MRPILFEGSWAEAGETIGVPGSSAPGVSLQRLPCPLLHASARPPACRAPGVAPPTRRRGRAPPTESNRPRLPSRGGALPPPTCPCAPAPAPPTPRQSTAREPFEEPRETGVPVSSPTADAGWRRRSLVRSGRPRWHTTACDGPRGLVLSTAAARPATPEGRGSGRRPRATPASNRARGPAGEPVADSASDHTSPRTAAIAGTPADPAATPAGVPPSRGELLRAVQDGSSNYGCQCAPTDCGVRERLADQPEEHPHAECAKTSRRASLDPGQTRGWYTGGDPARPKKK